MSFYQKTNHQRKDNTKVCLNEKVSTFLGEIKPKMLADPIILLTLTFTKHALW